MIGRPVAIELSPDFSSTCHIRHGDMLERLLLVAGVLLDDSSDSVLFCVFILVQPVCLHCWSVHVMKIFC